MATLLAGIDGTGPTLDSTYEAEFRNSFVRRLCPPTDPTRWYKRGPTGPGTGLITAVDEGTDFIRQRCEPGIRVLLTGYSRGALGVLAIAQRLHAAAIPVEAMMLFDAVARHPVLDAEAIPPNVKHVLHIMRDPSTRSRLSFGNCGKLPSSLGTFYTSRTFRGTHGAMGGTPWVGSGSDPQTFTSPRGGARTVHGTRLFDYIFEGFPDSRLTNVTYDQDRIVAIQIWRYVQPFLRKHGFIERSDVPDPDEDDELELQ